MRRDPDPHGRLAGVEASGDSSLALNRQNPLREHESRLAQLLGRPPVGRMEIAAWERLEPQLDRSINRRKVRAAMRRRLKYATLTGAIKEALALLASDAP